MNVCTAVVLVGYCLWAFSTAAEATARIPWFELSIVPFGVGVLRYTLLLDTGHGGAPEDVVLSDRPLLIMGGLWLVIYTIAIRHEEAYLTGKFGSAYLDYTKSVRRWL